MTKKAAVKAALAKYIDELGDLEHELAPWRPKLARVEVLRSSIRGIYDKTDPGRMYQASGDRWMVLVGKAGNQSVVDKSELLKLVGPAVFADCAAVSIKALEAKCPKEILGAVVSLEQVGPRPLTVVPVAESSESDG